MCNWRLPRHVDLMKELITRRSQNTNAQAWFVAGGDATSSNRVAKERWYYTLNKSVRDSGIWHPPASHIYAVPDRKYDLEWWCHVAWIGPIHHLNEYEASWCLRNIGSLEIDFDCTDRNVNVYDWLALWETIRSCPARDVHGVTWPQLYKGIAWGQVKGMLPSVYYTRSLNQ